MRYDEAKLEEKILFKTRIIEGDKRKRSDIKVSIYKIFHFFQFYLSFYFD